MKSYTDLEQSKKLAELLPLESVDMYYDESGDINALTKPSYWYISCPCWSLAALLEALPLGVEIHKQADGHKIYYYVELYMKRMGKEIYLSTKRHENSVDACFEMIITLHNEKLL